MPSKDELEGIAEKTLLSMPRDLKPSELAYVISAMLKGHAIALKNNENRSG